MASSQGGPGSVHHDDPTNGGNTAERPTFVISSTTRIAFHAASETSRREDTNPNTPAHETRGTGREDPDAPSPVVAARHTSSRPSTESGLSEVMPGMALPLESEADDGATRPSDNDNTEHPTLSLSAPTPTSPVVHVPQTVAQPDTTRVQVQGIPSPRVDWPSIQERYMAVFSRVGREDDRQNESYDSGLRLYAPNSGHSQSAFDERQGESSGRASQASRTARPRGGLTAMPEFALPRWQPDVEATYCPICRAQFSFFVRKHHCRKCGRVVCATCSPHRIIIPHQYIVRPSGSDTMMPTSFFADGLGSAYFESNALSGGERVRLCNPCVPDPNTAPPQSPSQSIGPNSPPSHHRSRSSQASSQGLAHPSNRYEGAFTGTDNADPLRHYSRARSITMNLAAQSSPFPSTSAHHISAPDADERETFQRLLRRYQEVRTASSHRSRHSSFAYESAASSSRQRALPPPPPIAEEDECPVCHRELPARSLPNFESLREAHISMCVQAHSTYGSPRRRQGAEEAAPAAAPRRSGMYVYCATEKDCVDDAECTICLEEFTVGIAMARLECLCRFHRSCISAWFVNHPGRCPVHQHDGFGF